MASPGSGWACHGPATALRLTRRSAVAPALRGCAGREVRYRCCQRVRDVGVTVRWRGSRPGGDLNPHIGAISPDRGNHAIAVTRAEADPPGYSAACSLSELL